jgi:hypothetical protein
MTSTKTMNPRQERGRRRRWQLRFRHAALVGLWLWLSLALTWPRLAGWFDNTPEPHPLSAGRANYVIVAPRGLAESAEAWAAYRRTTGYSVQLLVVTPAESTAERVGAAVQQIYEASGQPYPFYVLLLGHAHPQSLYPDTYLPTGEFAVDVARFSGYDQGRTASDDAYVVGGTQMDMPIVIGRVPARTNAEALRVLARTQAYESDPPAGAERAQVELIASASGFGEQADAIVEQLTTRMAERLMPAEYEWHVLWGNPNSPYSYPVAQFPAEVARRLQQRALLAAYIGHGQPDMLAWAVGSQGERGPVFAASDVWRLRDASATLVALTACSVGAHETAGNETSVAEALLLARGGPVAVYAPSEWIYAIANFRLAQDLFQGLLADQPVTVGEWLWRAETNFDNPGADRSLSVWLFHQLVTPFATVGADQRISMGAGAHELYALQRHAYNLFGDPALKIAYARRDLMIQPRFPWQPFGDALAFNGEGSELLPGQAVTVTLFAPLTRGRAMAADPNNAVDRYAAANDRVVVQTMVAADDQGQFVGRLRLPVGLPSGRYRLIAVAAGDRETWAGAHVVHWGWPPVGSVLLSPWAWWVGTSAALVYGLARRLATNPTSHVPTTRPLPGPAR